MTNVRFTEIPPAGHAATDRALRNLIRLLGEYDDEIQASLALKAVDADVTAELAGKSDIGHTHDDRYYTESEIDAGFQPLNGKLNDIAGLTLGAWKLLFTDGNNILLLSAPTPGGGDLYLKWNDTLGQFEWGT